MKVLLIPFAIFLFVSPTYAQSPSAQGEVPVVVVTGEGLVQAAPDRAWITVGAESRASTAREAQRKNTELMTPVMDKLKAAGLAADAIRTTGYDVQYEWDYVNGKRIGKGFLARNSVELRIDAVDRLGEFLEIAGGAGATSLGGVRFDVKARARLEQDAMRMAVVDARGKAEAAAAGAGRTLDRIVRIEERGAVSSPSPVPMLREFSAAAAQAPPPVFEGQIEVRASVSLTATVK